MKVVWLIAVAYAFLEGGYCLNSTQNATEETTLRVSTTPQLENVKNTTQQVKNSTVSWLEKIEKNAMETIKNSTEAPANVTKSTTLTKFNSTSVNQTESGAHGSSNKTTETTVTTNCANPLNQTCIEQSWNDTVKTNYSTVAEAIGVPEETPDYRLPNWAAVAAGIFLVSAALGYLSCVTYRQHLIKKYGNSQILIGEEVYDTTDLRNFEI